MGFKMPELITESVIRDGLKSLRNDPDQLDFVLEIMGAEWANTKFGKKEINKIKKIFQTKEIRIVHAYHQVEANLPCFSILLKQDDENKQLAHLGDFEEDIQEEFTDPEDIANLIVVGSLTPDSYDKNSGILEIPDAVNIDAVHNGHLFIDNVGLEHIIQGKVNVLGGKQILLTKLSDVTVGVSSIKSSINFKQFELQGVVSNESIVVGVHTDEPLLTKYFYTVLKYILNSRKPDLITRGFARLSYSGSDFSRNLQFKEPVYTRFYTVTGITENDWKAKEVTPIDSARITVLVEKDVATNKQLGKENATVQVEDDD